jgi:hypothetical protein
MPALPIFCPATRTGKAALPRDKIRINNDACLPSMHFLLEAHEIFASNCDEAKPSGERRAAGEQQLRKVGGVLRLLSYKLISAFLVRLLNRRLDGGANRAAADDLAQRTQLTGVRRGVEVLSAAMRTLAEIDDFVVVMEDFSGVEVNFTGEQHAYHQGAKPVRAAMIVSASQLVAPCSFLVRKQTADKALSAIIISDKWSRSNTPS